MRRPKAKTICGTRYNDLVVFPQGMGPIVEPLISFGTTELVQADGFSLQPVQVRSHWRDQQGNLVMPAGLLPRLARELRKQGHELAVEDQSYWQGHIEPDCIQKCRLSAQGQVLLEALQSHPRGRIVVADSDTRCEVIGCIADIFAGANVFVLAKNLKRRRALAAGLAKYVKRPVLTNPRTMWASHPRLYIGTMVQFQAIGPPEWDLIIFADPQSALAADSIREIHWLRGSRMFLLTSRNERLDPDAAIQVEALFGGVIHYALAESHQPRAVKIQVATPPWSPPAGDVNALQRKRELFWHNQPRNQALAQIAFAFRDRDLPVLWNHGVLLDEAGFFERFQAPPSVAILVESPEHAQQLGSLLPGWPVRTSVPDQAVPSSSLREQVIVTTTWAYQHRLTVDVIVRGDGTGSSWLPQWGPHQSHTVEAPLTIVDFADDADKLSVVDTNRRLMSYMANGWTFPPDATRTLSRPNPGPG